jgi:MFS transporter, DHA1 family, multidrug resistance protein
MAGVVEPLNDSAAAAAAHTRPGPHTVTVALALLLGLQPVTTDLYLPALPALRTAIGASLGQAQLTLSGLLLAFGFGQLLVGPLADRYGRRPVLLGGLALYIAASLGSVWAGSIDVLIAWRVVQGLGLACAVVCSRAMVRDLYTPRAGMAAMSRGLTGLGLIAVASPLAGGLLAAQLGWHAALAALGLYAAVVLGFIALRLPETLASRRIDALRPAGVLALWWRIARDPQFRAYATLTAATYGGLFAFLAGGSFVMIEAYGLTRGECGLLYATNGLAYVAGTFIARRWLAMHGARGSLARAAVLTLAGGASMAALALTGIGGVWGFIVPMCIYSVGHGLHQPCGQAGSVAPFPQHAGAAASVAGFLLALTAFGVGSWLGVGFDGSPRVLALTIAFFALLTATIAWTWVQRHGEPPVA